MQNRSERSYRQKQQQNSPITNFIDIVVGAKSLINQYRRPGEKDHLEQVGGNIDKTNGTQQ